MRLLFAMLVGLIVTPVHATVVEGERVYRLAPNHQEETVETQIMIARRCMLIAIMQDPRVKASPSKEVPIPIIDDAAPKCAGVLKGMVGMYNAVRGADTGTDYLQTGFVENLRHFNFRSLFVHPAKNQR